MGDERRMEKCPSHIRETWSAGGHPGADQGTDARRPQESRMVAASYKRSTAVESLVFE